MSRVAAWVFVVAAAVGLVASCGFGVADDTGKPIPAGYWKWRCPDGGAPLPDAGCPTDAAAD